MPQSCLNCVWVPSRSCPLSVCARHLFFQEMFAQDRRGVRCVHPSGQWTFSVKGQIVNVFCVSGHTASVRAPVVSPSRWCGPYLNKQAWLRSRKQILGCMWPGGEFVFVTYISSGCWGCKVNKTRKLLTAVEKIP